MGNKIYSLLEKTNNITRSSYIWNAISAMTLAMQSPVLLMVMNRTNGTDDAGVYSIAIAVANLMLFLGQYGLRKYQSSDVRETFKFGEYHAIRLFTCGLMVIVCLAYCLDGLWRKGYTVEKFLIIYMICLIKTIQAYADVLHGHLQQRGRLDIACKASTGRYLIELLTYIVILVTTKNLLLATIVCLVITAFVMVITSYEATRHHTTSMKPSINKENFKLLLIEGLPLFASMFLNMYISNAPKYAIDAFLTDEIQAMYNMIFMPTYVVQMVAQFIFNPVLTEYAELWLAHDKDDYHKLMVKIKKMCLVVLGLSILAVVIAATIGIPVLSIMFGADLAPYKKELIIIMISGGMLAYATYFTTIIAVIRAQKSLLICYGVVAIAAKTMSGVFVKNLGITGAALLYAALMTVLAVLLLIVTAIALNREGVRIKKQNA